MDEVTTFDFNQASWEDLRNEAMRLKTELEAMNNKFRYAEVALANRERQRNEAAEVCQRLVEDKTITDEDDIKILVSALGIEASREVAFTITVEISGTLDLPYGEDLDEYSFDVDSVTYDGNSVDISDSRVESMEWDEV